MTGDPSGSLDEAFSSPPTVRDATGGALGEAVRPQHAADAGTGGYHTRAPGRAPKQVRDEPPGSIEQAARQGLKQRAATTVCSTRDR